LQVVRDLQLLHQKLALPQETLWSTGFDLTQNLDQAHGSQKWLAYINQESLKLSMYAFYFLDFHLFAAGNIRPSLSSIEFEWDLPWSTELWEAPNSDDWLTSLFQCEMDVMQSTSFIFTNPTYRDQDYQSKSILNATQALLSNTPSPRLISILAASAFATICVVTNLECLVRDFTRCYYQLPPNLKDPSPYHVLTQRQNAQVATALGSIWSIMKDGPCIKCSDTCKSLWHAVRINCLSVKVSLSMPDDLLVGGIVECNPTAGMATAAHLTLGDYVVARRSGLSRQKTGISDDGMVALLDDLLKVMHEMSSAKAQAWEGPWTFIQGFKMLLLLWKALRMGISESQLRPETPSGKYPKLSRLGIMVVNVVTSAVQLYASEIVNYPSQQGQGSGDEDGSEAEVDYVQWMHMVCDRRTTWDVGHAMSAVLDEISAMTTDPVSLRISK
jgi:hypothetical protein